MRKESKINYVNTTRLSFPAPYLSNSQMSSYILCPKAYEFTYVQGIREVASPNMLAGVTAHKVLEIFSDMLHYDFNEEQLVSTFRMAFKEAMDALPEESKKGELKKEYDDEARKIFPSLRMYCKEELPKLKIVSTEIQVHKPISVYSKKVITEDRNKKILERQYLGDISVIGFLDFVHQKKGDAITEKISEFSDEKFKNKEGYEIGDYKTGSVKDHTHFVGDTQLPFYTYASGIRDIRVDNIARARVGVKKDGSPRADNIPPSYNVLKYKVEDSDIADTMEQYSDIALAIGMGSYPQCHATIWKCSATTCGHWYHCRGKKADKYLKKVAIEKYGEVVDNRK